MTTNILLVTALLGIAQMASSASVPEAGSSKAGLFAADLIKQISKSKTSENVIFSPVSIQSALALTYLGAGGKTASEIQKSLYLPTGDKVAAGKYFAEVLNQKKGEAQLSIANRLFVNNGYTLKQSFNDLAKKYFNSEAETLDFSDSSKAINRINSWVEEKTNNKIANVMAPGSVGPETSALIVNAIYFLGKWQLPFSKDLTSKGQFWVTPTKSVEIDRMFQEDKFKYAEYPELDATAIEMAYKDSDVSMMVILPKKRDGLAELEDKLSTADINELSSKMSVKSVNVVMPKFKIELETNLNDVLKALGVKAIFEDTADLSGIFESGPKVRVSDVKHKAFIDVNEAGSEAAAATIFKIVPMSLNLDIKDFLIDHPFVYVIKSSDVMYFVGHVAKF